MKRTDFRSDTVTWPTEAMRAAMASAQVGDDVYGEDPTVNELEKTAAHRLGKEAGLFVASGTMGNLVAILTHAGRGDEAIVGHDSHTISWEAGGMSALGGVVPRPLPTDARGRMAVNDVEMSIRPNDPHLPRSRLILLENSYGAKNGAALPPKYFASMAEVAARHGLAIHLDGARFFNAIVAQSIEPTAVTGYVDSVSFCLSKGLCAPVGSILCGSADFIHQARRVRKVLGGGMRQAGVLAAAGLLALHEMVDRLADDHARAQQLAAELAGIPGIIIDPEAVETNIVFFELADDVSLSAETVTDRLRDEAGVWLGSDGPRRFRAVTHYWIGDEQVQALTSGFRHILKSERKS